MYTTLINKIYKKCGFIFKKNFFKNILQNASFNDFKAVEMLTLLLKYVILKYLTFS